MATKETVYCATCQHCKVFNQYNTTGESYARKVRCAGGHWRTPGGTHKSYFEHTLLSRQVEECPNYTSNGDSREDDLALVKNLKQTLPRKKIIFTTRSTNGR